MRVLIALSILFCTSGLARAEISSPAETISVVFGLLAAVAGIFAFCIPMMLTDWVYSQLAGWGIVTALFVVVVTAFYAPALTRDLILVCGWGFALVAAILTRIAGHIDDLAPHETRVPHHVPEGGYYVSEAEAAKTGHPG